MHNVLRLALCELAATSESTACQLGIHTSIACVQTFLPLPQLPERRWPEDYNLAKHETGEANGCVLSYVHVHDRLRNATLKNKKSELMLMRRATASV